MSIAKHIGRHKHDEHDNTHYDEYAKSETGHQGGEEGKWDDRGQVNAAEKRQYEYSCPQ